MKSVFWKMFTAFTGILLMSFIIMAVFFYIQLEDFAGKRKIETLNVLAAEIYSEINGAQTDLTSVPETYSELEERNRLAEKVRLYAENINGLIWVVNEDGRMIAVSHDRSENESFFIRDFYNRTERYMFDKRYYEPYFKTNNNEAVATKEFADIFANSDSKPGLTYIKTFKIKYGDAEDDSKIGVYIHIPRDEITVVRREILTAYLIPWLLSLVAAGALIFLFSKNFGRPISGMVETAEKVAAGDFKARMEEMDRNDEIGKLGKSFNEMLEQIENLETSRQTFISDVSHELRTPITSIRGFLDGILDGTVPEGKRDHYLKIVRTEAGRLNRLVDDLLVLTRLENPEKEVVKTVFDLNELIAHVAIYMEREINDKELVLELDFEDARTRVYADRDDMERVIVNLLDNAIKFTPKGGGIHISTKAVKNKILVGIRDEGPGIDPKTLKMIWDRFYKADPSRGVSRKGSGLGLAIVRKIIKAHGEKIDVSSKKGEGTEFVFTIQQGL